MQRHCSHKLLILIIFTLVTLCLRAIALIVHILSRNPALGVLWWSSWQVPAFKRYPHRWLLRLRRMVVRETALLLLDSVLFIFNEIGTATMVKISSNVQEETLSAGS